MRAYAWFLAAIAGTLVLAALLAWPLYLLVHPLVPLWRFDKITERLWQLLMLGALLLVVRRLKLVRRDDWGYGAPRPRFVRQFTAGLLAGLATMLPVSASMLLLGLRTLRPDAGAGALLGALAAGLGSGLVVGFLEESFFRGLMQRAVVRELHRPLAAILLVALLYAALHFLSGRHVAHAEVNALSGLGLLRSSLESFARPGSIADAFLCLVAVGLLLGLVSWWTGSIAAAAGLHAGWVWVMRATVGITAENPAAPLSWLVSPSTGYTGWLVLGWTLLLLAVLFGARARLRRWRRPA
jgi:membrane protease YdiL (CAAX protease family)